jgi:hypothetical protein
MPEKKTPRKRSNGSEKSDKAEASPAKAEKAPAKPRMSAPARKQAPALARLDRNGSEPSHDQIAAKAYELWEGRGRPDGSPQEDWYRAQQELNQDREQNAVTA